MLKNFFIFCLLGAALSAHADWNTVEQDELEKPESEFKVPEFDLKRLIQLELNKTSSMQFGIDPQTIEVTSDWLVRYVVVASSPSGARNISYEGIRCQTAEVKTYARYNDGKWLPVAKPVWYPLQAMPSKHALQFAKQAACDGKGPVRTTNQIIYQLKTGNPVYWGS